LLDNNKRTNSNINSNFNSTNVLPVVEEKKERSESSDIPVPFQGGRRRRGDNVASLLKDTPAQKSESPDSTSRNLPSREGSMDNRVKPKSEDDFISSLKNDNFRKRTVEPETDPITSPKFQTADNSSNNIIPEKRADTELSFRAEKYVSSRRVDEFEKFKFENNNTGGLEANVLKERFDDEKSRLEALLKEEREKNKKLKDDHVTFIEELRKRHKDELTNLEEKYKINTLSLNDDNKKLRQEIDREVTLERERMQLIFKTDLENHEMTHKKNFEQQKKFFEDQNDVLKKQLQQQMEFNKLATKVELSSKQLEEILNKFYSEKEKTTQVEHSSLENKEKFLKDLEDRLKETEKQLNTEKEMITKMRQEFEMRELEKRRENQEEKNRVEKEILRLQDLQNSLKVLEYNAKEKYEREKLELAQKHNDMKNETDSLKSEYNQKLSEIEYQKKNLFEEKNYFEKFKDEALK
jgi:hypothetical protein